MQHVNEQHIVPQFLLENFSNDGLKIWSFDKSAIKHRWPNIKLRSIQSTPTEKHVYDKTKGEPNDSLEYLLRDIENIAAPILQKLNRTRDLSQLDSNDKLMISWFIASQMSRTKGEMNKLENIHDQISDFLKPHGVTLPPPDTRSFWLERIEKSDENVKHFLNKSWSLILSNREFYISDNPVVINNTTNIKPERSTLGLECKGIEIYLPISSSVVLCLYCAETFPYENVVDKAEPENVVYLNWLQVRYANRFIYAHGQDFELVRSMIDENAM